MSIFRNLKKEFRRKDFLPVIWIVPVTLLFSLTFLLGNKSDAAIEEILWGRLGGVVSASKKTLQIMLFTAENLYFMVLFHLLFGSFLKNKLRYSKYYVFIREKQRIRWFLPVISELLVIVFVYTFILLLMQVCICDFKSTASFTKETMKLILLLGSKIYFLLFLTTMGINLLSIRLGTAVSFIMVYFLSLSLVFMALKMIHIKFVQETPVLLLLNPVSGLLDGIINSTSQQVFYFVYHAFICVVVIFIGIVSINHMQAVT